MDDQDNTTKLDETKLNKLMQDLGYTWDADRNLWINPTYSISQLEAIHIVKNYVDGL